MRKKQKPSLKDDGARYTDAITLERIRTICLFVESNKEVPELRFEAKLVLKALDR